jgi:hypothetical protein
MKSLRELLATIGLLFTILIVAVNYSNLPQRIPDHFDANGLVNGWADKSSLWFLVGITCLVYLGMTMIPYAPKGSFSLPVSSELREAAIPACARHGGVAQGRVDMDLCRHHLGDGGGSAGA